MTAEPLASEGRGPRAARAVSFTVALGITLSSVIYPRIYASDMYDVAHGLMALLMLGMSACYVHGIGFVPRHPVLRWVFSPWVAWPVVALAVWGLATR